MEEQNKNLEKQESELKKETSNESKAKKPVPKIAVIIGSAVAIIVTILLIVLLGGKDQSTNPNDENGGSPNHTHTFVEWNTVKSASCTEEGSKESFCSCGEKQIAVIQKLDHTFGEWIKVTPATNKQNGLKVRFCECGEKDMLEIVVYSSTISYTEALQRVESAFEEGFNRNYWQITNGLNKYKKMQNGNSYAYYTDEPIENTGRGTRTWVIETDNGFIQMTEEYDYGKSLKYYYTLNELPTIYKSPFDINFSSSFLRPIKLSNCENISVVHNDDEERYTFTDFKFGNADTISIVIKNNLPVSVTISENNTITTYFYSYNNEEEFAIPDVLDFEER